MRIVRYRSGDHDSWGILEPSGTEITAIVGSIGEWAAQVMAGGKPPTEGASIALSDVALLPPVEPASYVAAVGLTYPDTLPPAGASSPIYVKGFPSLVGTGEQLTFPEIIAIQSQAVFRSSPELVAVIGTGYGRGELAGIDNVLGYTIANNGLIEGLRPSSVGHDLFGWGSAYRSSGLGPWIVTRDEFGGEPALKTQVRINRETVQTFSTADSVLGVDGAVRESSIRVHLEPGDLVFTGGPNRGDLHHGYHAGDDIEIEMEGIGVLANSVSTADTYRFSGPTRWGDAASVPGIYPNGGVS